MPSGEGKFPVVVMLHGTGSNRDEAGNGYKMAAPVLAEKYGIATIRIDFMGSGDSTADYTGYTFESAVSDAVAAANYAKTLEQIDVRAFDTALVAYEDERGTTLKQALRQGVGKRIALIVGPEGGFEEGEIAFLLRAGAVPVSLGRRILRTETAGMAMLAQVLYELE